MKRFTVLLLLILLLAGTTTTVFAHGNRPPEPTCQEGQETEVVAEWIEPVYEWQWAEKQYCGWFGCWTYWTIELVKVSDGHWIEPVCVEPEPEPVVEHCTWQQYVLVGEDYPCYLKRSFERGDSAGSLPNIYDGTQLMRDVCSETCTGKELSPFKWTGKWYTTCAVCDGDCQ